MVQLNIGDLGSVGQDMYLISFSEAAKNNLYALALVFNPYIALFLITTVPFIAPEGAPAIKLDLLYPT